MSLVLESGSTRNQDRWSWATAEKDRVPGEKSIQSSHRIDYLVLKNRDGEMVCGNIVGL